MMEVSTTAMSRAAPAGPPRNAGAGAEASPAGDSTMLPRHSSSSTRKFPHAPPPLSRVSAGRGGRACFGSGRPLPRGKARPTDSASEMAWTPSSRRRPRALAGSRAVAPRSPARRRRSSRTRPRSVTKLPARGPGASSVRANSRMTRALAKLSCVETEAQVTVPSRRTHRARDAHAPAACAAAGRRDPGLGLEGTNSGPGVAQPHRSQLPLWPRSGRRNVTGLTAL